MDNWSIEALRREEGREESCNRRVKSSLAHFSRFQPAFCVHSNLLRRQGRFSIARNVSQILEALDQDLQEI